MEMIVGDFSDPSWSPPSLKEKTTVSPLTKTVWKAFIKRVEFPLLQFPCKTYHVIFPHMAEGEHHKLKHPAFQKEPFVHQEK